MDKEAAREQVCGERRYYTRDTGYNGMALCRKL